MPESGGHLVQLAGQELHDVPSGGSVEERQDAVDGVQSLIAGNATGERVAHHPAQQLGDVGVVLRRPEGHQNLGSGAVPARRDAILGDQHSYLRRLLDPLRLDPVDLPGAEPLHRVVTEHVPDSVGAEIGVLGEDLVQGPPEIVRVGRVGRLEHQQRPHDVGGPLGLGIALPPLGRLPKLAGAAPDQHGVEVAGLCGDLQQNSVLDQAGLLHPGRVDDHRRQNSTTLVGLGRLHRVLELLDRRGDSPDDRDRRVAGVAVDQASDDRRLVGRGPRVEPAVRLVKDQVHGQVVVGDRVGDRLPDRPPLHVRLGGIHPG